MVAAIPGKNLLDSFAFMKTKSRRQHAPLVLTLVT